MACSRTRTRSNEGVLLETGGVFCSNDFLLRIPFKQFPLEYFANGFPLSVSFERFPLEYFVQNGAL